MASKSSRIKKAGDYFLAEMTYRKISEPIAILLSKAGITPNQVSLISIISASIAGFFFSFGKWNSLIIGYVFLQLTFLLDHVDGNLARYTEKSNVFGQWVDGFSNKLHKFFFALGISIGVFRLTDNPFYLILGSITIFNWFFASYISETKTQFSFKKDLNNSGNSEKRVDLIKFLKQMPFSLIMNNIFGLLILVNKPIFALWFISIVSLNSLQQIYSVRKYWKRENKV